MFRSYRVGRVLGIPLEFDVTFLLVLPIFAWLIGAQIEQAVPLLNVALGTDISPAAVTGPIRPWVIGFVAAVGLFVCVALHEFGHSLVAMAYDYEIESITLWLLGGVARPAELPKDWRHEFWIAIAGPAVSVAIGAVCYLALFVIPPAADVTAFLFGYLAILNVALAAFNMLPAFPLDGGRVLRALLGRSQSYVRATRQAASIGKAFAVLLGLFGILFFNIFMIAIAFFVYIAAAAESRQMMLDAAFDGVDVGEVMTPADELTTVPPDLPIEVLLDRMLEERHTGYPVVDDDGELVGLITLEDVQTAGPDDETVGDAMTPVAELTTLSPTDGAMEAFRELGSADVGRIPLVEDGELAGMVTRTDLMNAFQIVLEQRRLEDGTTFPERRARGRHPAER